MTLGREERTRELAAPFQQQDGKGALAVASFPAQTLRERLGEAAWNSWDLTLWEGLLWTSGPQLGSWQDGGADVFGTLQGYKIHPLVASHHCIAGELFTNRCMGHSPAPQ